MVGVISQMRQVTIADKRTTRGINLDRVMMNIARGEGKWLFSVHKGTGSVCCVFYDLLGMCGTEQWVTIY